MKCIILCGGYATRLHPLTLNKAKALLEVKRRPLLDYIIDKVEILDCVDEVFVVTNEKFYSDFENWLNNKEFKKKVSVLNDGTMSNEDRLGGIGDLWFALEKGKVYDDFMVVLGDNLFEFGFEELIDLFKEKGTCIGLHDIEDLKEAKRFGVIEVDVDNKIIGFEEKPENPKSSLISTGIYIFTKNDLKKIEEYMKTEKPKDGPGYLVQDFIENYNIFGLSLEGKWYDIGTMETYNKVNEP